MAYCIAALRTPFGSRMVNHHLLGHDACPYPLTSTWKHVIRPSMTCKAMSTVFTSGEARFSVRHTQACPLRVRAQPPLTTHGLWYVNGEELTELTPMTKTCHSSEIG